LDNPARIAVFAVTAWKGEPRNLAIQEHSDVRWFTSQEIEDLWMQEEARQEVLALLRPHGRHTERGEQPADRGT
jgi:hypothetical protein